jgi:uracil-DNA glycosylase
MRTVEMRALNDFDEWRGVARSLLLAGVGPDEVIWLEPGHGADLFDVEAAPTPATGRAVGTVPPRFLELGEQAICHNDTERFALLYRLLWRLQRDKNLLTARSDVDVGKLDRRVSAVRRDAHKMTAFVRFRQVIDADGVPRYLAWFEPEHYTLEPTAPFFVRRFAGMRWGIVTPYRSAFWDGEALSFGPGGSKTDVPAEDAIEEVWKAYYASIFNPARLKVAMMKSEMPVKYWRNLPEAELIPSLIRGAKQAEAEMVERQASEPSIRHVKSVARRFMEPIAEVSGIETLADAREAASGCTRCPLYEQATQTVFGEGPETADIMFVGEQPGDQEDLAGHPFVGPAGQVFNETLKLAEIDRSRVYVTNSVKHFKFEPRGKRRIHQKPNGQEIAACRFWVGLERQFVKPGLIVAMGATAVTSLMGKANSITSLRGRPIALDDGTPMWVTVHPSYLLRIQDRAAAAEERRRFEDDMKAIRDYAATLPRRHAA